MINPALIWNVESRLPIGGEFQGFNGDCVEDAFMVARSAAVKSACDRVELNRLTNESIRGGQAGPAGQMTNANLAWLCSTEKVPYIQHASWESAWDYIALLRQYGGVKPIVMGFSNGQALPGNEQNVFGHAVALLMFDGKQVVIVNGDSTNGRNGQFDTVTLGQLAAAQPQQITILELTIVTPYDGYFTQHDVDHWTCNENGYNLEYGFLHYWQDIGGTPGLPIENARYNINGVANTGAQCCERGVIVWDAKRVLDNPPTPGDNYLAHVDSPIFGLVYQKRLCPVTVVKQLHLQSPTVNGNEILLPYTLD